MDTLRVRRRRGYTINSRQPSNKPENYMQRTIKVAGGRLHGCKPLEGAELEGGGPRQIRLAENLSQKFLGLNLEPMGVQINPDTFTGCLGLEPITIFFPLRAHSIKKIV